MRECVSGEPAMSAFFRKEMMRRKFLALSGIRMIDEMCNNYNCGILTVVDEKKRDVFNTAPVRSFPYFFVGHIWCGRGKCILPFHRRAVLLETGSILILPPDTPHILAAEPGTVYQEDYCFFAGSRFERMQKNGIIMPMIMPSLNYRFLLEISEFLRRRSHIEFFSACSRLESFLLRMYHLRRQNNDCGKRRIDELLTYLVANPEHWWTVNSMAEYCNCSLNVFRKLFFEETDMLPKRYIENLKMSMAAELLRQSDASINEIWKKLRFAHSSHFISRFGVTFGCTPGEYRRRFGGKISGDQRQKRSAEK